MSYITSKAGSRDNVITYEHICDSVDDLQDIDPRYVTLGSVAIVLDATAGLSVYMANSNKQWISLTGTSSDSDSDSGDNP